MNWRDKLRSSPWLLLAIPPLIVVVVIAPWQLGVLAWSLLKLTIGIYFGYWAATSLERGRHPHEMPDGPERDALLNRRALIVAAVVIALGLGV
jgi:hypothetical protein